MQRGVTGWTLSVIVAAIALAAPMLAAQDRPQAGPVVVLDTFGFWRMHHTLKPALVDTADGLKPVLMRQAWLNAETAEPPAGWQQSDFDDAAWVRNPLHKACRTSYLARLCLRGKFTVADPARVKDLRVSVAYQGGAVVYVNGKEVARGHLPAGADPRTALADGYPKEAFVTGKGTLLVPAGYYLRGHGKTRAASPEWKRGTTLRRRRLADVVVPKALLRKGVNVLAVEVVRAPYHRVLDEIKGPKPTSRYDFRSRYDLVWNTCQINRVQLTTAGAESLTPNAVRPKGLQLWNSNALKADYNLDWGDPTEPLRPVRLVGPRGGIYSGKVVLGSTRPVRGLRATPRDLKGPGGATIPASAVRIRYGLPWGNQAGLGSLWGPYPYPRRATILEAIADAPLAEFPVREVAPTTAQRSIRPKPVLGAVVPLWLTVGVPRDARPGAYTGEVRIEVDGEPPEAVPLAVEVLDWTLPERGDRRTWIDMVQSPATLALEYGLDRWSERHWQMIARSFRLMGEAGNKSLYVPLIAHTNLGNDQSMVRWVDNGDGTTGQWQFDFSIMDRYLDTALEHMGRPQMVVLNVWDVYMIPKADGVPDSKARSLGKRKRHTRMAINLAAHKGKYGLGPLVTFVDPKTGATENDYLPTFHEMRDAKAAWGTLMRQLRERMRKRGLEGALMLGMLTDAWPSKADAEFFKEVAPGIPWMIHSHDGHSLDKPLHGVTPVVYQARVWGVRFADNTPYKYTPVKGRMYGWKQDKLNALFERFPNTDTFPATKWRHTAEYCITGDQRGIGRLGADFWHVIKGRRGRRAGRVPARFPEAHWRNLNLCTSLLAPGPDGPASTNRYEQFREGIQQCEARIAIERALTDNALKGRLGADLARRAQETLDERILWMWKGMSSLQLNGREFGYATGWRWTQGVDGHRWFVGSGWQDRSAALYRLAAEVDQRLEEH